MNHPDNVTHTDFVLFFCQAFQAAQFYDNTIRAHGGLLEIFKQFIVEDQNFEEIFHSDEGHNAADEIDGASLNSEAIDVHLKTSGRQNSIETFVEHDTHSLGGDLSLRLHPRFIKTDEEIIMELKYMCRVSDPLEKYRKTKELGEVASGFVFMASDIMTDRQVVVRTIDLKNQPNKETILNEIKLMTNLIHDNLVNYLEAYFLEESDLMWVVFEHVNG